MRRMLAVVFDRAANLWASRAAPWRPGTSISAVADSSSHPTQLALVQQRRKHVSGAAALAVSDTAQASSNVQLQQALAGQSELNTSERQQQQQPQRCIAPWDDLDSSTAAHTQQQEAPQLLVQARQDTDSVSTLQGASDGCSRQGAETHAASAPDAQGVTPKPPVLQPALSGHGSRRCDTPGRAIIYHRYRNSYGYPNGFSLDSNNSRLGLNSGNSSSSSSSSSFAAELGSASQQQPHTTSTLSAPLQPAPIGHGIGGWSPAQRPKHPDLQPERQLQQHHQGAVFQAANLSHKQGFQQQQQQQQQQEHHFQQQQQQQQALLEQQQQQQQALLEQQQQQQVSLVPHEPLVAASGATFAWAHPHDRVVNIPPDVLVVDGVESAKAVVDKLLQYAKDGVQWVDRDGNWQHDKQVYFACDTEVANIDVKTQSPVGHGTVICLSIYAHPQADFQGVSSSSSSNSNRMVEVAAAAAAPERRVVQNRIWVDLAGGWWAAQQAAQGEAQAQVAAAAAAAVQEALQQPAAAAAAETAMPQAAVQPVSEDAELLAAGSSTAGNSSRSRRRRKAVTEPGDAAAADSGPYTPCGETAETAASDTTSFAVKTTRRSSRGSNSNSSVSAHAAEEVDDADVQPSGARRRPSRRTLVRSSSRNDNGNGNGGSNSNSIGDSKTDEHAAVGRGNSSVQPVCAAAVAVTTTPEQHDLEAVSAGVRNAAGQQSQLLPQVGTSSSPASSSSTNTKRRPHKAAVSSTTSGSSSTIASSSSGSSSSSRGRPAASALYNEELPAPTAEDLLHDPTAQGIIEQLNRFFGDASVQKVWHNYGFDRHVLEGLGFHMAGFGGDTLHMSRLWDASRKFDKGGYSLESLSADAKINAELLKSFRDGEVGLPKRGMKERFGLLRMKSDGQPAKVPQVPPMHVLHTDEHFRHEWIDYSALDAKATWNVHRALQSLLRKERVVMDSFLCERLAPFKQELAGIAMADAITADTYRIEEPQPQQQQQQQQQQQKAPTGRGGRGPGPPRPRSKQLSKAVPAAAVSQPGSMGRQAVAAAAVQAAINPATAGGTGTSGSSSSSGSSSGGSYTLLDLYCDYWKPFGELLTAMEAEGVRVNRDHLAEQELKAIEDQQKAEEHFRSWAKRYVPGAAYMNVNSQVQIRQMLFPDNCAEPVKVFKAPNPEYTPDVRPRLPRWLSYELHSLWGKGQPGRLAVDVTTDKGTPAVSGAVLWSLVGKPGAARKALDELLAQQAAAEAPAGPNSSSSSVSAATCDISDISIHEDASDELHDVEDVVEGAGSITEAAAAAADVVVVPAADTDPEHLAALQDEAAKKKLGKMYAAMGGGREGIEACLALEQLIEVSAIDKLLTAFIQPLQQDNISTTHRLQQQDAASTSDMLPVESATRHSSSSSSSSTDGTPAAVQVDNFVSSSNSSNGTPAEVQVDNSIGSSTEVAAAVADAGLVHDWHRVHCSLNLNTETGRLSARRPNLQNQPALEKDRYKVRKAFCAEQGKTLVVADYGQLELRLLAHMANCKSMIDAFELGGDFHSRTALGMYDYIKEDIANKGCLLEWDGGHEDGPPPVPLLKDKYASERRKAKILNFSIAYGKTAHGLSKDWGVSLEEAEATVQRWYADRPEVRDWQARQRCYARDKGWVNTMIGRRRSLLPGIRSTNKWERARAERAAINTPIQGSAADVASAAMLAIDRDVWLRENGWKLLLQVHDEVMLEGPEETAEQAKARVVACMENPWENLVGFKGKPLRVDLVVDANIAHTWYEAK